MLLLVTLCRLTLLKGPRVDEHDRHEATFQSPPPVLFTDIEYLREPGAAFERMRAGEVVVIQPSNGCARMVLGAEPLSAYVLDDLG